MRCGSHLFRQLSGQLFGSQESGIFIAKKKREYAADSAYMYSYVYVQPGQNFKKVSSLFKRTSGSNMITL